MIFFFPWLNSLSCFNHYIYILSDYINRIIRLFCFGTILGNVQAVLLTLHSGITPDWVQQINMRSTLCKAISLLVVTNSPAVFLYTGIFLFRQLSYQNIVKKCFFFFKVYYQKQKMQMCFRVHSESLSKHWIPNNIS